MSSDDDHKTDAPKLDPERDRVTSPAPATTREWPRFTDEDRTPVLGILASEFPDDPMLRAGFGAWPPPLPAVLLPSEPARRPLPPTVVPPRIVLPTAAPVELAAPPSTAREGRMRATPRDLFLPRAVPPPRSNRKPPPTARSPRSEPPSVSNMAFSQRGVPSAQDERRPPQTGWYVSGVLGVLLFLNLFHARPEPTPHAAGGQPSLVPVESAPEGALVPRPAEGAGTSAPGVDEASFGPPPATTMRAKAPVEKEVEPAAVVRNPASPPTTPAPRANADDGEISLAEATTRGAAVAREHGDPVRAAAQYTRALQANPAFFPASLGLADSQWSAGNKPAAQAEYRRMLATFPASMIPEHARARAAESLPAP